jgi:hypothetical protein
MFRIQSFFLGSLATGVVRRLPGAHAHTRRVITGVLITLLLGFAGASAVPPQQRERASDWATDSLDLVSASTEQIRDVLAKDPGLMVELKRLMAKQAIDKVDAYDLLLHGIRGDLKHLENGDTLLVPSVGPQVSVDGMVRRPAVYELRGETNLEEVLALAGGVLPAAALRHTEVQRLEAHEKRMMLSVNLDETSDPQAVRR